MNEEQPKTTLETVAETRAQMTDYLCLCGVRDVSIIVGAVGTGILAGFAAHHILRGRWRSVPIVVSLALTSAAYFSKQRFVVKSALAVSGVTLLLSNVHFTFWDQLEEERMLEA